MMRNVKPIYRLLLCTVLGLVSLGCAMPANGDEIAETFGDGDTGGWLVGGSGTRLSNPGDHLRLDFDAQWMPTFVEDAAWVQLSFPVRLTNIVFRLKAETVSPSAVRVVLRTLTSGHTWRCNLSLPEPGEWKVYSIPLSFEAGWYMGPDGSAHQFGMDTIDLKSVGIEIRRHSTRSGQSYAIDDVALSGVALLPGDMDGDGMDDEWEALNALDSGDPTDVAGDPDNDGMSNYQEYLAGTQPQSAASALVVNVGRRSIAGIPVEGIVLRWPSVSNRTYAIWRTLDLRDAHMVNVEAGIPATPPLNEYEDATATNGVGFYRIGVE